MGVIERVVVLDGVRVLRLVAERDAAGRRSIALILRTPQPAIVTPTLRLPAESARAVSAALASIVGELGIAP